MNGQLPLGARVAAAALATVAAIVVIALTNPPPNYVWAWALLVVCVTLTALGGTQMLAIALVWIAEHIQLLPFRKIVLTFLAVAVIVGGWWWSRPLQERLWIAIVGCPHPAEVRVMTAPELVVTYRGLANEFESLDVNQHYGCPIAELHVYAPPVAKARDGLMAGWSSEYLRDQGPRPDVWLPESMVQVEEVKTRKGITGFGPDMAGGASIATTPIVLGLPASAGVRPDDPAWQGQTWAALVRDLQAKKLGLLRPASTVDTVGDFATVALYTSENNGAGLRENPSYARLLEQWIDRTFTGNGYPAEGDVMDLLRRERDPGADQPIVLSEQELVQFNSSLRHEGSGCDTDVGPAKCLLAFYPTDTHRLDLPFVQLTWSDDPSGAAQQSAAAAFGEWLTSQQGRRALVGVGLRPPGASVSAPIVEANGVLPAGPQLYVSRDNPPPAVRSEMRAIQTKVKQPARLLITVDASGSMNEPVGGDTRFQVATGAVKDFVGRRPDTSLMVFSASVGIHPVDLDGLLRTRPAGNTPQYRAIQAGVQAVGPGGVLVVLTDGVNNVDQVNLDAVGQSGVRVLVLAFGEASCDTQVLVDVTNRTGGGCRQASVDTLRSDLAELLRGT
jgi:Ca-activated chloride channel family protein